MAFDLNSLNPGLASSPGGPKLIGYETADSFATIEADGYMDNAADLMNTGDFLFVYSSTSGWKIYTVTESSGDVTLANHNDDVSANVVALTGDTGIGTAGAAIGAVTNIDDLDISGLTETPDDTPADGTNTDDLTDSTSGTADDTIDAVSVTDSSGGTADGTIAAISETITGVDGAGSNAASKAEIDTELAKVNDNFSEVATELNQANNNFKEIADQLAAQRTFNTNANKNFKEAFDQIETIEGAILEIANSIDSLLTKQNAVLTAMKASGAMAADA